MWQTLASLWPWLLALLDLCLAGAATVHAVLWKRDSRAAIGWVGLVWLAPLVGPLAYFCFGINRIQRKATALRVREAWQHSLQPSYSAIDLERADQITARFPNLQGLVRVVQSLTGQSLLPGNRVVPLLDGDEAYPAMLRAIEGARETVTLLTYIFDSDRAGERFVAALAAAQRRGVMVRVLVDDIGARYSRPSIVKQLSRAGVRTAVFLPTRVPRLFQYANLRNHRKILVVDGRQGFTGGTNIREGHWRSLQPRDPIQCLHFAIEGPVVTQMQETFAIDWAFATGESLRDPFWFPEVEHGGPVWARGISDGPDEDFEKMPDAIMGALTAATESVHVVTPYFLPEAPVIRALNVAAMRGVEVRIMIPEAGNIALVNWACAAQLWQVLEKGCRVFLTPPPFDHSKLMIVDGVWSLIGSSNWDPRSLRLNFEFNLECYDDNLAQGLEALIVHKAKVARELTLEHLDRRSLPVRLRDGLARLATPYL
jgi:cardiolipin synthase